MKTEKPEKPKKPESPRGLEAPEPTIKAKEKLIYRRCHHHTLETIEPEWLHTSRHYSKLLNNRPPPFELSTWGGRL